MSSSMKLRTHIRAPKRYGEEEETPTPTAALLQSMRQARGQAHETHDSRRVEFDPNLPPAAFPTLEQPRSRMKRARGAKNRVALQKNGVALQMMKNGKGDGEVGLKIGGEDERGLVQGSTLQQQQKKEDADPDGEGDRRPGQQQQREPRASVDHISFDEIDNYAASNNRANPVYLRNLAIMSGASDAGANRHLDMEDSDLDDDMVDASEVLEAKIQNPIWSDLHPAVQIEIIENMLKTSCLRSVCRKLGLSVDDRRKVAAYMDTRNKQIGRENKQLRNMRKKQLRALLRIDNSVLKMNRVPPQLVLSRIFRRTARVRREGLDRDLLMCQAVDVLAARQFLHQHGLPRNYAGDWGHSFVVLREPDKDDGLAEMFEWKGGYLELSSPEASDASTNSFEEDETTSTKKQFIQSVGEGSAINPRDLIRHGDDEQPIVDWGRYFPYWYSDPASTSHRLRSDGLVRLRIGTQQAAQIQQLEQMQRSPQRRVQPLHSSSPPGYLEETPSRLHEDAQTFSKFGRAISMSLSRQNVAGPVTRSLGGQWSLYALDPAVGQARYRQQIEQARMEMQQRKNERQRPRHIEEEVMTERVDRTTPAPVDAMLSADSNLPSEVMSQLDKLWDDETTSSKNTMGDVDPAVLADIRDTLTTVPASIEETYEHMFGEERSTGEDDASWFDEVDEMVLVPTSESVQPASSPLEPGEDG